MEVAKIAGTEITLDLAQRAGRSLHEEGVSAMVPTLASSRSTATRGVLLLATGSVLYSCLRWECKNFCVNSNYLYDNN
mgnify:CR=1 FL=1